jgi:Peptidase family M48
MRNSLMGLVALVLLQACANAPKPLTYRQQLDIYKDMKTRLYKVAAPIKIASVSECPNTGVDNGILTHRLSDYPEYMRDTAHNYWGLEDEDTVLYETQTDNSSSCYVPLVLDYSNISNAHTDGENIFIAPALLDAVDDLTLALIISHELAHIALDHINDEPSEELERAADRFALFMLARAGLDYKKAALQGTASQSPHMPRGQTNLAATPRADYYRAIVAEIETLQANGKALVP